MRDTSVVMVTQGLKAMLGRLPNLMLDRLVNPMSGQLPNPMPGQFLIPMTGQSPWGLLLTLCQPSMHPNLMPGQFPNFMSSQLSNPVRPYSNYDPANQLQAGF